MRAIALAAAVGLLAAPARADTFPARSGETGIIDVPDAEVTGERRGQLGVELGLRRAAGASADLSALPMYVVAGFAQNLDVGLTMREFGEPGDPRAARMTFGAAAKLQLAAPGRNSPGIALSTVLDRFNEGGILGARLAVSTKLLRLRFAAFGGGEADMDGLSRIKPTGGLAVSLPIHRSIDLAAEALAGGRGRNYGGAIRWTLNPNVGASLGANWFPGDDEVRVALTLAFSPSLLKPTAVPQVPIAQVEPERIPDPTAPRFTEDRPRFRLRMAEAGPDRLGAPRRLQHGPYTPSTAVAAAPQPAPTVRGAAPTLEDLAEAQLRDQEALSEARERRVRATSEQLEARETAALEGARRLDERERALAAREQQLEARDRRIAVRGTPTQQERDLQALELQLAAQERNLLAQSRSYGPALDAAEGRVRAATAREETERQEASRLAAAAAGTSSRGARLDLRKQALAARNRQLAALEARLVANGERIDALERRSRVTGDRLDAWQRRLDARSERLDVIERRLTEPRPLPAGTKPAGGAAAPADKAVFVMVVKTPTSIVKGRPAAAPAAPSSAPLHAGALVEKVVAGATVVTFASPESRLSELDQETVDKIARLAAKDGCELMIWARAKDPSLQGEAQRRASEIKARVIATGPLDESKVTMRVTIRPAAKGVDVVVTALRETATPAPAAPAAPPPEAATLETGEAGKRQIRETIQAAQSSIEACVAEVMEQKKLVRAEAVLKLTVSPSGKVSKVASEGDVSGTAVGECLGASAARWSFPRADAEYVVDVPITVIRGDSR